MILPKPIKLQVERYIGGLSQFKKIDNPIKLSANESALGPSPKAIQAFEKDKDKIFKYPESESNSLREVLSEKFNIDSKRIICGSGSDQIFDLTCHLFLEPGNEVIVTEFGFIMHRIYASLHKAKVILAKEKNFKASVDEILKKVTNKTKIVFIANPNNPTGTYLTKNEMLNLRKKLRSNILMVVDDAYFEFLDSDDFASGLDLFKDAANVLVTRTFSKIYGLAGLRVGYSVCNPTIADFINRVREPFNVNHTAQIAAICALSDLDYLKKSREVNDSGLRQLEQGFERLKLSYIPSHANFIAVKFSNAMKIYKSLLKEGVIVRPVEMDNFLRISIGTTEENTCLLRALEKIL